MALAIVVAFLTYRLVLIWNASPYFLTQTVFDDAFYYSQTARNISQGLGISFDGINPTNGFHPLWLLVIVPVYSFIPARPELAFRVVLTLGWIIAALVIGLAYIEIRKRSVRGAFIFSVFLFLWPRFSNLMFNGMESAVSILLLMISYVYISRTAILSRYHASRQDVIAGMLLALAFLARLDNFLLLPAMAFILTHGFIMQRRNRIARAGLRIRAFSNKLFFLLAPATLVAAAYSLWNLAHYGHPLPISARLKSSFPSVVISEDMPLKYADFSIVALLATLLVAIYLARYRLHLSDSQLLNSSRYQQLQILVPFGLFASVQYLNVLCFTTWGYSTYFFASYVPVVIFGAALGYSWFIESLSDSGSLQISNSTQSVIILLALIGAAGGQYYSFSKKQRGLERIYFAATWARSNLPSEAVVAMTNAGLFAYFSERNVISTDGLVNNTEFQDYLKEGRFRDYLYDKGVCYLAEHEFPDDPLVNAGSYDLHDFSVYSYLYAKDGGSIALSRDREFYRSDPYENRTRGEPFWTSFLIWTLDFDFCN